jgi:peptidoglycan/LPS O-acetylase OafA/YrhL
LSEPQLTLLRSRMPELDTLRGIAISGVLLLHSFYWQYSTMSFAGVGGALFKATGWGWSGVNLFFVLSGFLITGILLDTREKPRYFRQFYIRRALRILPAYYGLLALLAIFRQASWYFLGFSFIYLANVTPLFGTAPDYGPLWSLAVEEHFYLFWPGVVRRLNPASVGLIALLICSCLPLLRLAAFRIGTVEGLSTYTWLTGDGLAMGSAIACFLRIRSARLDAVRLCVLLVGIASLATFAGIPFGIMTRKRLLGAMFQYTVVNCFCAGLLLLFLLLGTSRWRRCVNAPFARFLGYVSYGLYLIHLLVFRAYDALCKRLWPSLSPDQADLRFIVWRFVIVSAFAVTVAFLSRRYFEQQFLKLKDRLAGNSSSAPSLHASTHPISIGPREQRTMKVEPHTANDLAN